MAKRKKFMLLAGSLRDSAKVLSGFARKIRARGHEVLIVGPEKHRETAVRNRIPFAAAGSDMTSDPRVVEDLGNLRYGNRGTPGDNDAFSRRMIEEYLPRQADDMKERLDEIVREYGPDAILHDSTIPPELAARYGISGTPVDTGMGLFIASLDTEVIRPGLSRLLKASGRPDASRTTSGGPLLTPDPMATFDDSGNVQGFRTLGRSRGVVPPGAYQTDGLKAYVSLAHTEWRGAQFEAAVMRTTELAIRSMTELGIDSVVVVGPGNAQRYQHLAGDRVHIEEVADQLACMAKADFALIDGGLTAVLDALSSKGEGEDPVAVLNVPQHGEQIYRATELDRRGMGITIDPDRCSPREFTEMVQYAIDQRAELAAAARDLTVGLDEFQAMDQIVDRFEGPASTPSGAPTELQPDAVILTGKVVESSYEDEPEPEPRPEDSPADPEPPPADPEPTPEDSPDEAEPEPVDEAEAIEEPEPAEIEPVDEAEPVEAESKLDGVRWEELVDPVADVDEDPAEELRRVVGEADENSWFPAPEALERLLPEEPDSPVEDSQPLERPERAVEDPAEAEPVQPVEEVEPKPIERPRRRPNDEGGDRPHRCP